MIFKIDNDCILYARYLREQYMNQQFDASIDMLCRASKCSRSDITITPERSNSGYAVKVKPANKNNRPAVELDGYFLKTNMAEGLIVEDLDCMPKELRGSNINHYLSDKSKKEINRPLLYEYFWIENTLFLETPDVVSNIKFKIAGVHKLPKLAETMITVIREHALIILDLL